MFHRANSSITNFYRTVTNHEYAMLVESTVPNTTNSFNRNEDDLAISGNIQNSLEEYPDSDDTSSLSSFYDEDGNDILETYVYDGSNSGVRLTLSQGGSGYPSYVSSRIAGGFTGIHWNRVDTFPGGSTANDFSWTSGSVISIPYDGVYAYFLQVQPGGVYDSRPIAVAFQIDNQTVVKNLPTDAYASSFGEPLSGSGILNLNANQSIQFGIVVQGSTFDFVTNFNNNKIYLVMAQIGSNNGSGGPQGFQGSVGIGFQGFQGAPGEGLGVQGYQGLLGYQGAPGGGLGVQGYQGAPGGGTGVQGYQGSAGYTGLDGTQGPQGEKGLQGTFIEILENNLKMGRTGLQIADYTLPLDQLYLNQLYGTQSSISPNLATYVTGDLIPSADGIYNLGSSGSSWESIYVSGNTINIGGVALSTTTSGAVSYLNLSTEGNSVTLVNTSTATSKIPVSLIPFSPLIYGFAMYYTDGYTGATSTNFANQVYSSISIGSPYYNGLLNPVLPSGSTLLDYQDSINSLSGSFYIIQLTGFQGETGQPSVNLNIPTMDFTVSGSNFIFEQVSYVDNIVKCGQGDMILMGMYINTITTDLQANLSQITFNIPIGSVGSAQIADLAVTNPKIAYNAVATYNLQDLSVTNAKLASSSVATTNLQNGSVTNAKLSSNAVGTTNLIDGSVSLDKLSTDVINLINAGAQGRQGYQGAGTGGNGGVQGSQGPMAQDYSYRLTLTSGGVGNDSYISSTTSGGYTAINWNNVDTYVGGATANDFNWTSGSSIVIPIDGMYSYYVQVLPGGEYHLQNQYQSLVVLEAPRL
jgi:hypothetical protein